MDEGTRKRVIDRHRTERRKQVDSMKETLRQLKLDINAHISSENTALKGIRDRIVTLETALAYLTQQDRQDETTIRLPALPDTPSGT
jgi:hypothetical protein